MRKSYIREKKIRCGDEYMAVGVYAVTDQEHRKRGKKRKESDNRGRRVGIKPPACARSSGSFWRILISAVFPDRYIRGLLPAG